METKSQAVRLRPWQRRLHTVIFEADTPAGKFFDVALILCILASVLVVMLDSVSWINARYGRLLYATEWFFTIVFTVEYVLRLACIGRPLAYAGSFFGVVDLLAVIPTYISVVLPSSRYLLVIRLLRVLRIFRVLKFVQFVSEASQLRRALIASRRKISVFLFAVVTVVVILGSFMYVLEGEEHGFTSIPKSVYWAIVTLTTVGYGDISPQTALGQAFASIIMIIGYGIIAVPTGIVTVELGHAMERRAAGRACGSCGAASHDDDAQFCKKCGALLPDPE